MPGRSPQIQPALEVLQPADIGKTAGVDFEIEQPAFTQRFALEAQHAVDVFERNRIVIANRLADQALRIVLAHARQVLHQHVDRLLLALDGLAVLALPQLRFLLDQFADFRRGGQRQRETRAHALQVGRHVDVLADKDQRARRLRVFLRNFLDQTHIDRIVEIRLRIEHHVDAVLRGLVYMAQGIAKFISLRHDVGARSRLAATV